MTEKLIRWFQIIYSIQAKPGISVTELALKSEANERTIYRDLLTLSAITPITNAILHEKTTPRAATKKLVILKNSYRSLLPMLESKKVKR